MMNNRASAWVVVVCLFAAVSVPAQSGSAGVANSGASASGVPRLIKFSGAINPQTTQLAQAKDDESGKNPLPTVVGATFSLYELQEGGSPLWAETQKVQVDEQGRYTVLLGATQPEGLPLDLFTSGKALWLGVQPQLPGQPEQPRVLLAAVPYSLKSSDADTLGGLPASAYMLSANQNRPDGAAGSSVTPLMATAAGLPIADGSTSITGGGTANYLAMFTGASTIANSAIYNSAGGLVGIGTNNPLLGLDLSGASSTNGVMIVRRGVQGADPNMATTFGSPYLFIGGTEYKTNSIQSLGFGFSAWEGSLLNPPGEIGFQTTNTASYTSGDLVFGTRNTTTNVAATEAMRITSAGSVGIGTTAPAATLEVNGTAKFDSTVTFAAGQTFPGAGGLTGVTAGPGLSGGGTTGNVPLAVQTCPSGQFLQSTGSGWVCAAVGGGGGPIIGVTAGTDLTGGGSSGVVMLNLDTTSVPQLGTANAFFGNQTVTGTVKISGSGNGLTFPDGTTQTTAAPGLSGVREFLASGSFTVAPNITHVMVEMWGAGGGGSASASACSQYGGGFGGGGAAYTRDVIPVTPGATYSVLVGAGGAGSTTGNGGNGGDSQVLDQDSNVLLFAGGGQGATAPSGGAGGQADPKAAISHPGFSSPNPGGYGYPYAYNLAPALPVTTGIGDGGGTNCSFAGPPFAGPGGQGYVLLVW